MFKHFDNITVMGDPAGEPRTRATAFRSRKTGKIAARVYKREGGPDSVWRNYVNAGLLGHIPREPLDCPIRVDITFIMPRPEYMKKAAWIKKHGSGRYPHTAKPDRDNLDKLVLDAMTKAGMWRDDALAFVGTVGKWYADISELPHALISIWTWESGRETT